MNRYFGNSLWVKSKTCKKNRVYPLMWHLFFVFLFFLGCPSSLGPASVVHCVVCCSQHHLQVAEVVVCLVVVFVVDHTTRSDLLDLVIVQLSVEVGLIGESCASAELQVLPIVCEWPFCEATWLVWCVVAGVGYVVEGY